VAPLDDLRRRELLVVTGKGGVGKTAIAATLGRALAAAGRRTLVLEVDPRESLHQMFGLPPSAGEIVAVEPRLWVQNLKPVEVLDELVRERVKVELLVRRVLESPVYQHFAPAAPGLKEMAVLGHALRLLRGIGKAGLAKPASAARPGSSALDTVVLDAPATGHGVLQLTAPLVVSEVLQSGPFGRMAEEVRRLVQSRECCGVVVVTQAEEMPVEEALELRAALAERLGRGPDLLVVNGLYPPVPVGEGDGADPITRLWRRRRALNERQLARLATAWEGPRVELPLLPLERGPRLVSALAMRLEPAPAGVEGAAWS
jgi:anion-transporting  ArsA/GET3 family ATPase